MLFLESFQKSNPMLDWTCTRGSTAGLPMMDTFPGYGVFQSPTSMWMTTLDDESDRSTPPPPATLKQEQQQLITTTASSADTDMMDISTITKTTTTMTTVEENRNEERDRYWSIVQSPYAEDKPPSWVEVKIGFPEMVKADSNAFLPPPTPPATPPVPEYYPSAAAHSTPLSRKSTPKPKSGSPKAPFRELNVSKVQKIRTTATPVERNRRSGAPSPTSTSGNSVVRKSHSVPPKVGERVRGPVETAFECVYYQRSTRNGKKVSGSVTTFSSAGGGSSSSSSSSSISISSASSTVKERKQHDQREKRLAAAFEAGFLEHLFGKRTAAPVSVPVSPTTKVSRVVDLDVDMDMEQDITNPGPAPADDEFPAPPPVDPRVEKMTPPAEGDDVAELRKRFERVLH